LDAKSKKKKKEGKTIDQEKARKLAAIELRRGVALVASVVVLLGACFGFLAHALFCVTPGPALLQDHFPGVWMTAVLAFFAVQAIYELTNGDGAALSSSLRTFVVAAGWYAAAIALSVAAWVGYAMQRHDNVIGVAWASVLLWWEALVAACVISSRYRLRKKRAKLWSHSRPSDGVPSRGGSPLLGPTEDPRIIRAASTKHFRKAAARAFRVVNMVLRGVCIVLLALLASGALQTGIGYVRFPPRGRFVTVHTADGRSTLISIFCEGPVASAAKPTIWWTAGGGHWAADLYGVSQFAAAAGRRSCIIDRPGGGHSGWPAAANNYADWMHEAIVASGELRPSIVIGMAEAWTTAYHYGVRNPRDTAAVVILGPQPAGLRYYLRNGTADPAPGPQPAAAPTAAETRQRFALATAIRGIAAPFGLMRFFIPWTPGNYTPATRYPEFHWWPTTSKFWTTQGFELLSLYN
jgi:hypothetical protein